MYLYINDNVVEASVESGQQLKQHEINRCGYGKYIISNMKYWQYHLFINTKDIDIFNFLVDLTNYKTSKIPFLILYKKLMSTLVKTISVVHNYSLQCSIILFNNEHLNWDIYNAL